VAAEPFDLEQSWDAAAGSELVPGCRVQTRLGGGLAYEAYACFDDRLLVSTVVKIVRPHLTADPNTLRTLERETAILGALNHPVIVRGLHAELGGPRPYLAMERVPGPRLSTLLRKYGPLSIEQILPLGMQISSALHYLHATQVVHLDIKPSNIIMDTTPRLIDFSIARSTEAAAGLDHLVGTDQYLSPEQGDPLADHAVGPASDVWGLGATLFHATTGRRPFVEEQDTGTTGTTGIAGTDRDASTELPQLHGVIPTRVPGVPREIEAVILECLQWNPAARPAPAQLFDAFDPWAAKLPKPRLSHLR